MHVFRAKTSRIFKPVFGHLDTEKRNHKLFKILYPISDKNCPKTIPYGEQNLLDICTRLRTTYKEFFGIV